MISPIVSPSRGTAVIVSGSITVMHPRDQTIFALSSGRPPSAIALVRASGPQAQEIVTALAGKLPSPRTATRVLLTDVGQRPIDDAVVLWFPGPASATGEDVAEFHVHERIRRVISGR